jgi:hypothetical protein
MRPRQFDRRPHAPKRKRRKSEFRALGLCQKVHSLGMHEHQECCLISFGDFLTANCGFRAPLVIEGRFIAKSVASRIFL